MRLWFQKVTELFDEREKPTVLALIRILVALTVVYDLAVVGILDLPVWLWAPIDQGGVSETSHPTSISNPIYLRYGVIHCAVTNMPALVCRTASQALSKTLLPYVLRLAGIRDQKKISENFELKTALNVCDGEIIHPKLKTQFRKRS